MMLTCATYRRHRAARRFWRSQNLHGGEAALLPEAELLDERAVALEVGLLEVVQQPATLADEHQQAAAGVVILAVLTKMLGEIVDPRGEQSDLDTGVPGVR